MCEKVGNDRKKQIEWDRRRRKRERRRKEEGELERERRGKYRKERGDKKIERRITNRSRDIFVWSRREGINAQRIRVAIAMKRRR